MDDVKRDFRANLLLEENLVLKLAQIHFNAFLLNCNCFHHHLLIIYLIKLFHKQFLLFHSFTKWFNFTKIYYLKQKPVLVWLAAEKGLMVTQTIRAKSVYPFFPIKLAAQFLRQCSEAAQLVKIFFFKSFY